MLCLIFKGGFSFFQKLKNAILHAFSAVRRAAYAFLAKKLQKTALNEGKNEKIT